MLEASVAATPNAERYLHVFFSNKARCLGDVSTAAAVPQALSDACGAYVRGGLDSQVGDGPEVWRQDRP